MKKVLITALVFLMALAVVAAPVAARGRGGRGGGSPLAVAVDEMKIKVSNFNFGWVTNSLFASANTGFNWTQGWGTDVDTGKATVGADVTNGMNDNVTTGDITDAETGPIAINFGFGDYKSGEAGTDCVGGCPPVCKFPMPCWFKMALWYWQTGKGPVAIAYDKTEIKVKNMNWGFVINDLDLFANSGFNWTVGSKVKTGPAAVTANVTNTVNTNTTDIDFHEGGMGPVAVNFEFGGYSSCLEAECHPRGRRSVPLAIAVESDKIGVSNFNFAWVTNDVLASANTGWNMTRGRGADVDTGNATVTSDISTTANTNTTSVSKTDMASGPIAVNVDMGEVCGDTLGVPCLPVGGTGPVAANVGTAGVAVAVEKDEVKVENNNTALVTNTETLSANTGNNVTSGCPTDPCKPVCKQDCGEAGTEGCGPRPTPPPTEVDTGDASVTTSVTNTVNTNSTTITVSEGSMAY